MLPLFLMAMTGLIYIGQLLYLETRIQLAMEQIGGEMAAYYYAVEALDGDEEASGLGSVIGELAQGPYLRHMPKGRYRSWQVRKFWTSRLYEAEKMGSLCLGLPFFKKKIHWTWWLAINMSCLFLAF